MKDGKFSDGMEGKEKQVKDQAKEPDPKKTEQQVPAPKRRPGLRRGPGFA